MPSEKHPADCGCEGYGCTLRRKSISTRLATGRSGPGASGGLGPNVRQTSRGQDGAMGRDAGGNML